MLARDKILNGRLPICTQLAERHPTCARALHVAKGEQRSRMAFQRSPSHSDVAAPGTPRMATC